LCGSGRARAAVVRGAALAGGELRINGAVARNL
jgi:hypothetical protein